MQNKKHAESQKDPAGFLKRKLPAEIESLEHELPGQKPESIYSDSAGSSAIDCSRSFSSSDIFSSCGSITLTESLPSPT